MSTPIHIYFRPQFHPGTTECLSQEDLQTQIYERHVILRKHAGHEALRAMAEMLDMQAVRMTAEAMQPEPESREHRAGQAYAASYIAGLLRQILDHRETEPGAHDDNDE